jgi:hypothetical protein
MAEEIRYYAVVNEFSTRKLPLGVVRRVKHEGGQRDEVFSGVGWEHTALLYSAERGDTMNELIPITAEEAGQIIERARSIVGGQEE